MLAIFQGEHAYISPNWYPSKAHTHKVVPTWNYEVVHVHGRVTFYHGPKPALAATGQLTKKLEQETNGDAAWRMSDMPETYRDDMLAGIVAFEIDITQMIGKSKLSQNKTDTDRLGAVDGLGAHPIAEKMKNV